MGTSGWKMVNVVFHYKHVHRLVVTDCPYLFLSWEFFHCVPCSNSIVQLLQRSLSLFVFKIIIADIFLTENFLYFLYIKQGIICTFLWSFRQNFLLYLPVVVFFSNPLTTYLYILNDCSVELFGSYDESFYYFN